jgi:hypothetical protein
VPIVFANVPDPDSLARPGGNITGFMQFEYSSTAKWLELLKEVARGLKRVAVLRDATITPGIGQFAVIQSVSRHRSGLRRAPSAFATCPRSSVPSRRSHAPAMAA